MDKWELFALFASLISTALYWYQQLANHIRIATGYLQLANLCLVLAFSGLLGAGATLFLQAWQKPWLYLHWIFVLSVALLFLLNDLLTWKGLEEQQKLHASERASGLRAISEIQQTCSPGSSGQDISQSVNALKESLDVLHPEPSEEDERFRKEAYYGVFAADLPMVIAFVVLAAFLGIHYAEHAAYNHIKTVLLVHKHHYWFFERPFEAEGELDIWRSTEYFVGGAIAFQFIVSTIVYILISAKVLHEIHIETTETTIATE